MRVSAAPGILSLSALLCEGGDSWYVLQLSDTKYTGKMWPKYVHSLKQIENSLKRD